MVPPAPATSGGKHARFARSSPVAIICATIDADNRLSMSPALACFRERAWQSMTSPSTITRAIS